MEGEVCGRLANDCAFTGTVAQNYNALCTALKQNYQSSHFLLELPAYRINTQLDIKVSLQCNIQALALSLILL
jgi:hypothetical protein